MSRLRVESRIKRDLDFRTAFCPQVPTVTLSGHGKELRELLDEIPIWRIVDSDSVIHFLFKVGLSHLRVCDGNAWAGAPGPHDSLCPIKCLGLSPLSFRGSRYHLCRIHPSKTFQKDREPSVPLL